MELDHNAHPLWNCFKIRTCGTHFQTGRHFILTTSQTFEFYQPAVARSKLSRGEGGSRPKAVASEQMLTNLYMIDRILSD